MMTNTKPLSIFKPGTHISAAGTELSFSEADLAATAAAYNCALHKAPLVLGHPKDNTPAYGWVNTLAFANGFLQALPEMVTAEFSNWVAAGHYKKMSAAFYPPDSPVNPVQGVYYLRHIGFLGGQPPAVKGLPEPEFAVSTGEMTMFAFADGDTEFITIDFREDLPAMSTQTEEDKARLADEKSRLEIEKAALEQSKAEFSEQQLQFNTQKVELEAQKRVAKKRTLTEFTEALVKQGRLLPKDKLGVIEFMDTLNDSAIEFGEGTEKTKTQPVDWFKNFLSGLPKQVDFTEKTPGSEKSLEFTEDAQAIAQAASEYQEAQKKIGRIVDDVTAVQFVLKNTR